MKSKILGLDIGSINTGIAISDSTKSIAFSYLTVKTSDLSKSINQICNKENIEKIVVGKNLYQSKNFPVESIIEKHIPDQSKIVYMNEDFSTQKAKELADLRGLSEKEFKLKKDELSAQVILQEFIDQIQ